MQCANNHEMTPQQQYCPTCGAEHKSITSSSTTVLTSNRKNAGIMMIAGAALVAVGTALPWVSASLGYYSITRNAFQFGKNLSMTLAPGPIILIMALVMAFDGLRLLGIFGAEKENFSRPTVSTVIVAVNIFFGMTASFSSTSQVSYSISFGPLVSILGVAAGMGAIVLMYRDWKASAKSENPAKQIGMSLVGAVVVGIVLSAF